MTLTETNYFKDTSHQLWLCGEWFNVMPSLKPDLLSQIVQKDFFFLNWGNNVLLSRDGAWLEPEAEKAQLTTLSGWRGHQDLFFPSEEQLACNLHTFVPLSFFSGPSVHEGDKCDTSLACIRRGALC